MGLQEVPAACCGPGESVNSDQDDSTFELRACCPGMRVVRSRAGEASLLAEAPREQKHQGTRKPWDTGWEAGGP